MTQDSPTKKYPHTTAEVAQMLGIHPSQTLPMGTIPVADLPVPGLPVVPDAAVQPAHDSAPVAAAGSHANIAASTPLLSVEQQAAQQPAYVKVGKALLPFAAVFLVGIFLYYFFFTKVDFSNMFQGKQVAATPQQTVLQQLEQQDAVAFNKWINSYYYDIKDPKIVDPENDNSGNGLTNFQKYLLNLNPKSYDTLGLGAPDSQTIASGINPLTATPLTDDQKAIVNKYVDMEVVMNRLTMFNLQHPSEVAGAFVNTRFASSSGSTDSANGQNTTIKTITTSPIANSQVDTNTSVPGLLEIPSLKIKVPIIWSNDPKNFDQDLQVGVVHYPGTAMPGEIGTTYIAGHSSNYVWAKGSYNQIFSKLGDLALNTSFKITVTQKNGKTAVFNYVVTKSQQYSPIDQAQFANSGKSIVALSTCWPVGSTAKRLVLFGELTQVQN